MQTFESRSAALVTKLGLAAGDDVLAVRRLAGGVASDIGVVQTTTTEICVKFALARLRVAQDWRVPVSRNRTEYDWLAFAATIVPDAVPRLFGRDHAMGGFAMEFVAGPDVVLWKTALMTGRSLGQEAPAIADALGKIHRAGATRRFDANLFANSNLFRAIRIDPYLRFTALRHPSVKARLDGLADGLCVARQTLVHGDISPKNILIRPRGPVFLDAECAAMGDPAFDLAFCINHLVLKAVHVDIRILASIAGLWAAYVKHVNWEDSHGLQARTAALIPALMLARIDGKSPVDYLSDQSRAHVRQLALQLLGQDHASLSGLVQTIANQWTASKGPK
jgi:5-methylthioribose kinase